MVPPGLAVLSLVAVAVNGGYAYGYACHHHGRVS